MIGWRVVGRHFWGRWRHGWGARLLSSMQLETGDEVVFAIGDEFS